MYNLYCARVSKENEVDPVCMYPGKEDEPVMCMVKLNQRIFYTCGSKIMVLDISRIIQLDKEIETSETR